MSHEIHRSVSQAIPGDNHCVTMVTEGAHEDWYLIPSQYAGTGEGQTGTQVHMTPAELTSMRCPGAG